MKRKIETTCKILPSKNVDKARRLFFKIDDELAVPIFAIREIYLTHNPENSRDYWYIVIDIGRELTGNCNPYIQVRGKNRARKVYRDILEEIEQFYMKN